MEELLLASSKEVKVMEISGSEWAKSPDGDKCAKCLHTLVLTKCCLRDKSDSKEPKVLGAAMTNAALVDALTLAVFLKQPITDELLSILTRMETNNLACIGKSINGLLMRIEESATLP